MPEITIITKPDGSVVAQMPKVQTIELTKASVVHLISSKEQQVSLLTAELVELRKALNKFPTP